MSQAPELPGDGFPRTRSDASELIALEIRRYLERHELQPGDRIGTEQELAAEFGVSRPTLREGLRLLASSHLIRVGRGRSGGIFVARTPNEGMSRNVSEPNPLLQAFTGWILDILQPNLVSHISVAVDGEEILRQHREIQRAVRRRQPAAAERAMRAHIEYLQTVLRSLEE
jgi:DNA-binding FadR family transcriptional regulator